MIAEILLAVRLMILPDVRAADALAAARGILASDMDPELAAAMAWRETRMRVDAVSRVRGKLFCGPTQLESRTWRACRALQHHRVYDATLAHLDAWRRFCAKIGNPDDKCALAGYGHGAAAARRGSTRHAREVLCLAGGIRVAHLSVVRACLKNRTFTNARR